ncbi:MAG: 3-deoxy-manno-octulosonate cytidylyltransferase [Acidobacteriota bacterium]|nr:3-deoxy-manno-octulosonate cytidylyltransferase [Pyrinomonadaceae bacterium]MDW8305046.1 3-deoxy-manno-octulosonate cytidylyltransferase [Acidobacteriota bacterium]
MQANDKKVFVVIPARLESSRLKRKLLLPLEGKPLILHTLERVSSINAEAVIVASDSEEILEVVESHCDRAVLTSKTHQSGSDRVAEVAESLPTDSIIINVQADEPLISPSVIEKVIEVICREDKADIVTTCEQISEIKDVLSPNVVKVVFDSQSFALYFSRSAIPFPRESVRKYGSLESALKEEPELLQLFHKHTGLYAYRREALLRFSRLSQTPLEKIESLEQLRALENGFRIKVLQTEGSSIGVDTEEDLRRVQAILRK